MTVNVQKPYVRLLGDGSKTNFAFEFGSVEAEDILVLVDGVLMVPYSTYDIEDRTDEGGEVAFGTAPAADAVVLILRRTTISQQVDYTVEPFMAETHEFGLDKLIYILQDLISGAFTGEDSDGNLVVITFDLSVTAGVTTVTINNSGGTDAVLPPWVSGETAGVFHGEVCTTPPDDGAVTTMPDGYIWIEVAA